MRAMWEAQPRDKNFQTPENLQQRQYHGGNQNKKYNGDFHTLLGEIEQVKAECSKGTKTTTDNNRKKKDS